MARKEKGTRVWGTLIYPRQGDEETCPDNWAGRCWKKWVSRRSCRPCTTRTPNRTGRFKKPHRHVLSFEGVKSEAQGAGVVRAYRGRRLRAYQQPLRPSALFDAQGQPGKRRSIAALDVLTFGGFEYKRYASTKEDEDKDTRKWGRFSTIMAEGPTGVLPRGGSVAEEPELFAVFRQNSYFFGQLSEVNKNFTKRLEKMHGKKIYLRVGTRAAGLHNLQICRQ